MDLSSNSILLQRGLHEICLFFMRIFKNDEIPSLPEFTFLNELYPNEQKFKIISFLISAAIDVFSSLPQKTVQSLIGCKIGIWRTLVLRLCLLNEADVHHLPLEIDVIASRNKLVIDSLIFNWPFCNNTVSDLLEYLCDSFHGSSNVTQPYIDEYAIKFKHSHKRGELIKCIASSIKWVHAVQGSPTYSYTKDVLKNCVTNMVIVSDIVMRDRDGQFEEVWNEICEQLNTLDEFETTRIDSYPLYCSLNPLLKTLSDFIRLIFVDDNQTDFTKVVLACQKLSEPYDSQQLWQLELTNTMLTALNTVMIELLFRKIRSFSKTTENNLKMFINALMINNSYGSIVVVSEVRYWVDRLKRKKIELPLNVGDFFTGVWSKTTKEKIFKSNLEEYFLKILTDDLNINHTPSLIGVCDVIVERRLFQKFIIKCLANALESFEKSEPCLPPILQPKIDIIFTVISKIAEYYGLKLESHFYEKVVRVIENVNDNVLLPVLSAPDIDDKYRIIPVVDVFNYKQFVAFIWQCCDLSNQFSRPINIQEYLIDLRYQLFSKIHLSDADRIVSRVLFYVGWRFLFRAVELSTDELVRFHLVFNFLGENIPDKPLLQQSLRTWMRQLSSNDVPRHNIIPYQADDFFKCAKVDSVKNHLLAIFRGTKHVSMPKFLDIDCQKSRRGFDSTKSIIVILRQLFGMLNEKSKTKNDSIKNWLKNSKAVETDLCIICSRFNGDLDQVLGELNYLIGKIRESIYGETDTKNTETPKEANFRPRLKIEDFTAQESDSGTLKRKNNFTDEEPSEKCTKLAKLSITEDKIVDDKTEVMELMYQATKKKTIFSKVNFIDNSVGISGCETLESRIIHVNEPSSRSICIDVKKDKLRPARYAEIEPRSQQIQITSLRRPTICNQRESLKSINQSELTSFFNFQLIRQIGQGRFGTVLEAVDKSSNARVALKKTTLDNVTEGVPQSILREILFYRANNNHPNIIQFLGIAVNEIEAVKTRFCDSEIIVPKSFYFVIEYMEHDLHGLMKSRNMIFSIGQIGMMAKQLFKALSHLHEQKIVHRDVVPSNIMISNRGVLKLADFGNARFITKDVNLDNNIVMTPKIVSYLYRAPEILLDFQSYGTEVDVWSAGCVLFEMLTGNKLFTTNLDNNESNETMFHFVENIAKVLGSPNNSVWPAVNNCKSFVHLATRGIAINYLRTIDDFMTTIPSDVADVLKQIFLWDPKKRITAKVALNSDWLRLVEPQLIDPAEFPEKNCHEYLLDNCVVDKEDYIDIISDEEMVMQCEENCDENDVSETEKESINDEDLKEFVESLSGKILALNDILDRLRQEPIYSAEICKGIVMRAAREWTDRESMRVRMVPFMLDYLLNIDEKGKLYI